MDNPILPRFLDSVANLRHRTNTGTTDVGRRHRINWLDNATGVTWTLTDDSINDEITVSGATAPGVPSGAMVDYAGSSAPTGWLLCFGQSLLRTDYAALFTAIGTTYGTADGTHFNVPDKRGRVSVPADNMGGSDAGVLSISNTLGTTGGEENHTLSSAEMPSHTHTQDAHHHATALQTGNFNSYAGGLLATGYLPPNTGNTTDATATNQNTGGGGVHNNMQPYIVVNVIIKI